MDIWGDDADALDLELSGLDSDFSGEEKKSAMLDVRAAKRLAGESERKRNYQFLTDLKINTEKLKPQFVQIMRNSRQEITLPPANTQIRIRTQQSINLIGFIVKIIEEHTKIEALSIATYTLNRPAWSILKDLLKTKKIDELNILLASSYSFRDKKFYDEIKEECQELSQTYKMRLAFAWSHFKITLAKCGGNFYLMEGSMNYSANNMAEQLLFENNSDQYNHDYLFITEVVTSADLTAVEVVC